MTGVDSSRRSSQDMAAGSRCPPQSGYTNQGSVLHKVSVVGQFCLVQMGLARLALVNSQDLLDHPQRWRPPRCAVGNRVLAEMLGGHMGGDGVHGFVKNGGRLTRYTISSFPFLLATRSEDGKGSRHRDLLDRVLRLVADRDMPLALVVTAATLQRCTPALRRLRALCLRRAHPRFIPLCMQLGDRLVRQA